MSLSAAVDQRYRLQVHDLGDRPAVVTISNVTLQGLERLRPVLHFADLNKRMVLDDAQCDALARLTGDAVLERWIGVRIMLTPTVEEGVPVIRIEAPHAGAMRRSKPATVKQTAPPTTAFAWRQWLMLLLALAVAFGAIYLVDSNPTLWQQLLDSLPLG